MPRILLHDQPKLKQGNFLSNIRTKFQNFMVIIIIIIIIEKFQGCVDFIMSYQSFENVIIVIN